MTSFCISPGIARSLSGSLFFLTLALFATAAVAQSSTAADHAQHATPAASQAVPAKPMTWGLHGMVLFGGKDGLYASHLPMFHAPHDYQVVIELKLADAKLDEVVRARLAKAPALWTLVPEKFELIRLAPNAANRLTSFTADLVEGHFERGGATRYKGVKVNVVNTARFVQLNPKATPATNAKYFPIGRGHTWFLVKEVNARPDFDHVLLLKSNAQPAAITVATTGVVQPAAEVIRSQLAANAKLVGTIYYDTEDLK